MGAHGCAQRRPRRTAAAWAGLALAAAIGLAPAVAAAAPADRGPVAFTQVDTVTTIAGPGATPVPLRKEASEPAWSPDGRTIAFFTGPYQAPPTGVALAQGDGSGEAALPVGDGGRLSGLAWSPEGEDVQMAVRDDGVVRLVAIDVTTRDVRELGAFRAPGGAAPQDIAWSPAGRLVAFSAAVTRDAPKRCRRSQLRVFTYRLGGDRPHRIPLRGHRCARGRVDVRYPAFSPDGTRLVVTRVRHGVGGQILGTDLHTVDIGARGGPVAPMRPIAPGLTGAFQATFSPDGQRIAYLFARGGAFSRVVGLGTMRTDGTDHEQLIVGSASLMRDPDWGYAPRS